MRSVFPAWALSFEQSVLRPQADSAWGTVSSHNLILAPPQVYVPFHLSQVLFSPIQMLFFELCPRQRVFVYLSLSLQARTQLAHFNEQTQ